MLTQSVQRVGYDPKALPADGSEEPLEEARRWRDVWAAGQGVELIRDLLTVAELVARIEAEYAAPPQRRRARGLAMRGEVE